MCTSTSLRKHINASLRESAVNDNWQNVYYQASQRFASGGAHTTEPRLLIPNTFIKLPFRNEIYHAEVCLRQMYETSLYAFPSFKGFDTAIIS